MFAQNVSKKRIISGNHKDPSLEPCVLVQISDAATYPPQAAYDSVFVKKIHLDFEDAQTEDEGGITQKQVEDLVDFLVQAKESSQSIVAHCVAGISRSGAVVEFAVKHLGYQEPEETREPNKNMLSLMEKYYFSKK